MQSKLKGGGGLMGGLGRAVCVRSRAVAECVALADKTALALTECMFLSVIISHAWLQRFLAR